MPSELKNRLEREAKYQGVSLNQLANYMLTIQLTQLETISALERKLSKNSISHLRGRVNSILNKIPVQSVPEWDLLE